MASKRKLNVLSIADKIRVIEAVEKGGKKKFEIAKDFGIPSSTLSTILKNKEMIVKSFDENHGKRKKMRSSEVPDVETCLMKWISKCRSQNLPLGGTLLKEKAEEFGKNLGHADFKASNGWFENFKKRNNITFLKMCGESASVGKEICTEWKKTLLPILEKYDPKNVFNADETGLFFKCMPDKTITIKGEACHGGKRSKERVTLLLCANMDGSQKLKPLLIGKSAKPRCFSGIKSFPMDYLSNKKAWMTSEIFSNWLKELDKKMSREKRDIVLFLDNCTAHNSVPKLKSVKLVFMPPNTTSKLQPLDQGIIQSFKVKYRHKVVKKCIADIDEGKTNTVDILQAMRISDRAWRDVTQNTIVNCFKKAGFIQNAENAIESKTDDPDDGFTMNEENDQQSNKDWQRLAKALHIEEIGTFQDFVEIDNNVAVYGELSDADIINEVKAVSDEEDEIEEYSPLPKVTCREAQSSIEKLRNFIESRPDMVPETFHALSHLENVIDIERSSTCNQTVIDDYFLKQRN